MSRRIGPVLAVSKPEKVSSRVRISGPHARKAMHGLKMGKRHAFKIAGKLRGINSNDYDDSIEMDLDHCEACDDDMPKSLSSAMKRRRHMASGQYR